MQPAVRREQAEGAPTLVDGRRGRQLKAAHVMAPEAEAGEREREAAAEDLGHRLKGGGAVAAPVDGELLAAGRGGAGEDDGLALAELLLEHVEDGLVVEIGVEVVHLERIGAVVIDDVGGDALAEVGLEAVNAHVDQGTELVAVPAAGFRISEVHQPHTGLPAVPLEDVAVGTHEQVAAGHTLVEHGGALGHVGIDPDADLEATGLEAGEHGRRVGEDGLIPLKVDPLEVLHPVAVEVEDVEWNLPVGHALDKAGDGGLVIIGGKRGAEPEAEGPGRGECGAAGEGGVTVEHLLGGGAIDEEIVELLAGER